MELRRSPMLIVQFCPRCRVGRADFQPARCCRHCGGPFQTRDSRDPAQLPLWAPRQLSLFPELGECGAAPRRVGLLPE